MMVAQPHCAAQSPQFRENAGSASFEANGPAGWSDVPAMGKLDRSPDREARQVAEVQFARRTIAGAHPIVSRGDGLHEQTYDLVC